MYLSFTRPLQSPNNFSVETTLSGIKRATKFPLSQEEYEDLGRFIPGRLLEEKQKNQEFLNRSDCYSSESASVKLTRYMAGVLHGDHCSSTRCHSNRVPKRITSQSGSVQNMTGLTPIVSLFHTCCFDEFECFYNLILMIFSTT